MTAQPMQWGQQRGPMSMQVSLVFIERRLNVWLRFGRPSREIVLDRARRIAVFAPGAVCCRVKWEGNAYGTTVWQLMVLQAGMPLDSVQADLQRGTQRIIGVAPGASILSRAEGERQVKSVFAIIDGIEALHIDPCTVPVRYWRTVHNRLVARMPLPGYSAERHAAHGACEALR